MASANTSRTVTSLPNHTPRYFAAGAIWILSPALRKPCISELRGFYWSSRNEKDLAQVGNGSGRFIVSINDGQRLGDAVKSAGAYGKIITVGPFVHQLGFAEAFQEGVVPG